MCTITIVGGTIGCWLMVPIVLFDDIANFRRIDKKINVIVKKMKAKRQGATEI